MIIKKERGGKLLKARLSFLKFENMDEVKVWRVYRHFKGNYYFVEGIGHDSETQDRMVIYKPVYNRDDGKCIWVRPEKMFLEKIDENRADNITGQKHRFELVEELENNFVK